MHRAPKGKFGFASTYVGVLLGNILRLPSRFPRLYASFRTLVPRTMQGRKMGDGTYVCTRNFGCT